MAFEELYMDTGHREPSVRSRPVPKRLHEPPTQVPVPSSVASAAMDSNKKDTSSQIPLEESAHTKTAPTATSIQKSNRLLTFEELPHWMRDNHLIRKGYRPPSYHILKSLRSIFQIHNETVNIQTHLIGGLSFAFFGAFCTTIPLGAATDLSLPAFPLAPLLPFLVGAVLCLLCSATFHATSNVSPRVAQVGNQLDYLGIVCLITGSFISSIRLGYRCEPFYLNVYTTLISILGAACAIATMLPRFRTPAWRPVRAAMFVGLGLTAVLPMGQGLWMWGWPELDRRIGGAQMVLEGILYTSGAGLYAARWPERRWPGKVDILGSSHQIFHVLVVTAAWCHCWGTLRAMAYSELHVC